MSAGRFHGTRAKYVIERCRCDQCNLANRAYEARRRHAIDRPDESWEPYVDSGPARRHVVELREAGVGYKTVARLAGISNGAMSKLIYGEPARNAPPSKRIRSATAAKILAVPSDADAARRAAAGAQLVAAGPTWARLDELLAKGYTKGFLARALGSKAKVPALQVRRTQVLASTARAVEDLYRRLESLARLNGGHAAVRDLVQRRKLAA